MLHIVATPIGNLADLSPRALETLKTADLIACEDTRRTWGLLSAFNIPRPEMISYRQGNEDRIAERIIQASQAGRSVALCSDGGYPGISDPGYRLIRRAAQEKVPYDVLPGASAVDVALLLSGLSTSSFTFKGFPPRKQGVLRRFFEEEKELPHTLIIFESPFRVAACLKAAHEVLGDREAAVCIELTKAHERVSRGFLSELVKEYDGKTVKGEVAIVIAGNNPKFARADETRDETESEETSDYPLTIRMDEEI
jgi:16S rRNA (cytidine1402-2'-O)-methyltransferase